MILIYIRKGWCFAGWRGLFLVRVGERPKASLLRKGCMSCTRGRSGYGAVWGQRLRCWEEAKHCRAVLGFLLATGKACACAPSFVPAW